MHSLNTMAYLNDEAISRHRERADEAEEANESEPTYSLEDLEACREEAFQEGLMNGLEDNTVGWESGHESGWEDGRETGRAEAQEEFAGPDPLIALLRAGGVNPYEPVTLEYDAALKAVVYTQGDFTVTQSA